MPSKTNTWYKHIRAQHKEEYFTREMPTAETPQPDEQEMEDLTMFPSDDSREEPSMTNP